MTSGLWSDYETAAETLSQQVARDATALSRVTGGTTVAATFIRSFGRRAYRRDLTAAEETTYGTLFSSGATIFASGNAFADGVQLVIETMLQSPYFIYRMESAAAGQLLTGYEAASKLSFLLRNTMPDTALLDAAKAGSLNTADGIATQAQTMLDAMPARTVFQRFHTELFGSIATRTSRRTRRCSRSSTPPSPPISAPPTSSFSTTSTRRGSGSRICC